LAVVLTSALLVVAAQAYTPGVPTGLSGAPGEETCAGCHDNLNTGPGGVSITAPSQYQAGETIDVRVDLWHDGQEKWGFELTALDESDQPVGSFAITDAVRTQLDTDSGTGREYVMHTEPGTDTGVLNASLGWDFQWTAPASRASVTFYVAAVAANDAQGTNGDFTYTTTLTSDQTETGVNADTSWGRVKELFR
jgi:hypothetical protein